jgi:SH3-like domain-containing protein
LSGHKRPREQVSPAFLALTLVVLAVIAVIATAGAWAQSGRSLPRYVSLRAGEVNVRTGPGVRYPIEWVFQRKDLPVEVTSEYDTWRKIRDWEGTEGWVHQSMLSSKRMVLITKESRTLRREPSTGAPAVAHAEPGVVGALKWCEDGWCRVRLAGYDGWLKTGDFWGIYDGEKIE